MARVVVRVGITKPSTAKPDLVTTWLDREYGEDGAVKQIGRRTYYPRHRGKKFIVRRRGDTWSDPMLRKDALNRFADILSDNEVGDVAVISSLRSGFRWLGRTVDEEPDAVQTEGNEHIDVIYAFAFLQMKHLGGRDWGICNRRNIDGTTIWSQHSPWPEGQGCKRGANAMDIGMIGPDAKKNGWLLAKAIVNELGGEVCGKVLWDGQAWTSGGVFHPVPGIGHFDHLHVEGPVTRTGPPRASCP